MDFENEIAHKVLNICFDIHKKHGPGLFESVYEEILSYELSKNGFTFERQKSIDVIHDGINMDIGFRADFIVEGAVLLELKSVKKLEDIHFKQTLTYLRIAGINLALLINFNEALLKNGIKRVINGY